MLRAIGSKIKIEPDGEILSAQLHEIIGNLLGTDLVKKLDEYEQHCGTSRLQHCVNVAYYSYCISKVFHLDYRSSARGALLHDLFFYNWKESGISCRAHVSNHPQVALENAERVTTINKIERDIIAKHMWPLTLVPPRYAESYVVSFADKFCTVMEVFSRSAKHMALVRRLDN